MSEKAFLGDYHMSPYAYQPFGLKQVQLTCGGRKLPIEPLELSFEDEERVMEGYFHLLANSRHSLKVSSGKISKKSWATNTMILSFDCTPDLSSGQPSYHTPATTGTLYLNMLFSSPLPENVQLIEMSQFLGHIQVGTHGQVVVKEADI